jgi:hypothetical protein
MEGEGPKGSKRKATKSERAKGGGLLSFIFVWLSVFIGSILFFGCL